MSLSGIRGVLISTIVGGAIGFWVSFQGSGFNPYATIGLGVGLGLVASLLLAGLDRLKQQKSPLPTRLATNIPEEPLATNRTAGEVEEPQPAGISLDPFEASVAESLEKIRNPKSNRIQAALILAVSLVIFLGLRDQESPITFTVTLVGVLFFHELGHYLGMRYFGYRNLRMFFIPLFGAAVSGQSTSGKSYQQAIVTLLGPLPGLFFALALFGSLWIPGFIEKYRLEMTQVATLLALVNGFNLLPILPLDGGRLLNEILFSRNRYLEGIFQVVASLAVICYGTTQAQPILVGIGVGLLMGARPTFKISGIAQRSERQFADELTPLDAPIPPTILQPIVAQVRSELPQVKTAQATANVVFRIWEKIHTKPPGVAVSVGLLLIYLAGAAIAIGTARGQFSARTAEKNVEYMLRDANKDLPKWIDEVTRLDRIELPPDGGVSYIHTVIQDIPEQDKQVVREMTRSQVLAAPEMQRALSEGLTIHYKYYDTSHKLLLEFSVKK